MAQDRSAEASADDDGPDSLPRRVAKPPARAPKAQALARYARRLGLSVSLGDEVRASIGALYRVQGVGWARIAGDAWVDPYAGCGGMMLHVRPSAFASASASVTAEASARGRDHWISAQELDERNYLDLCRLVVRVALPLLERDRERRV